MFTSILVYGLWLLSLPTTYASREFTNHGTRAGWTSIPKPEAAGTVDEVTNVKLKSDTGLKMTQTFQPGYKGRYHSEVIYGNGYHRGDHKFYGFAFRLSEQWDFAGSQHYNIGQWIADFGDTGCDDFSPTSMIYLRGNTLFSRVKTGQLLKGKPCPDDKNDCSGDNNCQPTREFTLQKGIEGGVWYRLQLDVSWKSDKTGHFKAWVNGTKVHDEDNIATTLLDDSREFSFRVGLYANGWHDDGGLTGNQAFRQVWIDEVGVGSELSDVDPATL